MVSRRARSNGSLPRAAASRFAAASCRAYSSAFRLPISAVNSSASLPSRGLASVYLGFLDAVRVECCLPRPALVLAKDRTYLRSAIRRQILKHRVDRRASDTRLGQNVLCAGVL